MAISVKKVTLWRANVEDRPGMLADTLEPLAKTGADLQVVMGYHMGGGAVIELLPVTGKKATAAAQQAGLAASGPASLLVEGDNRPGMGATIARALGDAGININFMVAQVVGKKYSALFGFGSDHEATRAAAVLKKAASRRR